MSLMRTFTIYLKKVPAHGCVFLCCVFFSACMFDWETKPIEGTETDQATQGDTDPHRSTEVDQDSESDTDRGTSVDTATIIDTSSSDTGAPGCPTDLEYLTTPVFTDEAKSTNEGGVEFLDACPDKEVIIGFKGFVYIADAVSSSGVIGTIQTVCGLPSVHSEGDGCAVRIGAGATLPVRGDRGDIEWTRMCPQNEIVVGFRAQTGADIDRITFFCAPLVITREGGEYRIGRGTNVELEKAGGEGGGFHVETQCLGDTVATRAVIRAQTHFPVRAISLGCQEPSLLY